MRKNKFMETNVEIINNIPKEEIFPRIFYEGIYDYFLDEPFNYYDNKIHFRIVEVKPENYIFEIVEGKNAMGELIWKNITSKEGIKELIFINIIKQLKKQEEENNNGNKTL